MNKFKGLALGTSLALMAGLFTAAPVAAWQSPDIQPECAPDTTHYAWTVTLSGNEPNYKFEWSFNKDFSQQTLVVGVKGDNPIVTPRGGDKLYVRWASDTRSKADAVADGTLCCPVCEECPCCPDCPECEPEIIIKEVIKEVPIEVIKEVPVDRVVERIVQAPIPDRYEPFASLSESCGDPRIKARMDNSMSTLPAAFKVIWNRGKDGLRSVKHFNLAPGQVKVTDWIWVKGGGSFVRIRDQYQELLASVRVFSGLPWGTGTCQK